VNEEQQRRQSRADYSPDQFIDVFALIDRAEELEMKLDSLKAEMERKNFLAQIGEQEIQRIKKAALPKARALALQKTDNNWREKLRSLETGLASAREIIDIYNEIGEEFSRSFPTKPISLSAKIDLRTRKKIDLREYKIN